ncbi:hypothetical protein KM043_017170 [Ampulex compressa]|nr:hypothetical protein KM043_017170 [Ampulex compressa]
MSCVTELRSTSAQSAYPQSQDTKKKMLKNRGGAMPNNDEAKSSMIDLFPWLPEFKKMCRCVYTDKSMASLMELMQFYVRNVSVSVNECYTKPLRAAKLKDSISDTLLLFLYIYRELSEDRNKSFYLNSMSDLLALYIDMELKASKKSKEDHDKICARLTSCLYVYLEHSTEHLLDTLIKIQFMCRTYHRILDPIITKIIKSTPVHPESNTMYIRYLLIYRLWRKINDDVAVKNQITTTAIATLGPPPHTFPPHVLEDVLPKVPKCQPNSAKLLLQHKFDIKKTLLEKCIKKRKSRKLPWLKEAKKRIDLKVKTSLKIKKKEEEMDAAHPPDNVKNVDHQSEDFVKSQNLPEDTIQPQNNSHKHITLDTKLNADSVKLVQSGVLVTADITSINHQDSERDSMNLKGSNAHLNIESFSIPSALTKAAKLSSDNGKTFAKSVFETTNIISISNECKNGESVSDMNRDDSRNDKLNKQTVIKRLTEKDTLSAVKLHKRHESLRKICDLESEYSNAVDNITICTQYISKDSGDNSNCTNNYLHVTKDELAQRVVSSITYTEDEEAAEKRLTHKSINNMFADSKIQKEDCSHITTNSGNKCLSQRKVETNVAEVQTNISKKIPDSISIAAVKATVKCKEKEELCLEKNISLQKVFESQEQFTLFRDNLVHDKRNFNTQKANKTDAQAKLETGDCVQVNEDVQCEKSITADIKESIFESYSIDRKNISSVFATTVYTNKDSENNGEIIYRESTGCIEKVVHANCAKNIDKDNIKCSGEDNIQVFNQTRVPIAMEKNDAHNSVENQNERPYNPLQVTHNKSSEPKAVPENKYIIQDSELQDSIDGLSLLASVSQHVPHLKAEFELNRKQIKVKDYASLRNASYNQTTDDETDTNDSSNTVSQLLENPSTEIINRIVGIYPEDGLDKVALHVELTSTTDIEQSSIAHEACNTTTQVAVTGTDYDTDTLSNNLTSIESNTHSTKENTNVILNGETIVLLQKSPNSNLYIINKAVENSREHNSDDEASRLKEKNWLNTSEECGMFEIVNPADHAAFNLDLSQYSRELSCQENIFAIGRSKGIKIEPEDSSLVNLAEAKSYAKKISMSTEMLPGSPQLYQDVNITINKPVDKRKPKSNLSFRPSIKQEFNNISKHIAPNCGIQGCTGMHTHPHDVESQHSLHIPAGHPTTLSSMYGNCTAGTDLCVPYHKHCTSVSCSLQINTTTSLHSHTKSANPCGRTHCTCLNCTYDIVAHCRQCIHPTTDAHVSCVESNTYFLPTHSSVQMPAVQEHDRTKNDGVISKMYDDKLLCKIENSLLQTNSLEKLEMQCEKDKLFKKDMDNKLPLKKRLKAHAMMSMEYEKMPIKAEKLDNYPAIPMMSIAALESLDSTQKCGSQIINPVYELSAIKKDDPHNPYHFNSNIVQRGYYKDVHIPNSHHNVTKESTRKHERQFRPTSDQTSNAVCQESCLQRTPKTSPQWKETTVSSGTSLKRKDFPKGGVLLWSISSMKQLHLDSERSGSQVNDKMDDI